MYSVGTCLVWHCSSDKNCSPPLSLSLCVSLQVGRPNNVPQAAPVIAAIQEEATKIPRIYVASIHIDLSSEDVKRFAYTCSCTYMHAHVNGHKSMY